MVSRMRGQEPAYYPVAGPETPSETPAERRQEPDVLSRMRGLLPGLNRKLDTSDLILILILVFLYLEHEDEEELLLALAFLLLL